MNNLIKITIFLAITCFVFTTKDTRTIRKGPSAQFKGLKLSGLEKAFAAETISPGSINTGTVAGRADFARFLYMLVNGPIVDSNGTVEYQLGDGPGADTPSDTSDDGLIGMIRSILGPNALGLGLGSNGISSCEDIPASGSVSMTDDESGDTFTMNFAAPSKTIPAGYTNGGETFDNRINIELNGVAMMNVELDCGTTKAGWIRAEMDEGSGTARGFETYFEANETTNLVRLDFYMVFPEAGSDERVAVRFETTDGDNYELYLIRTEDAATDNAASMAVVGVASTGLATVKAIFPGNDLSDITAITAADNDGTIQEECLDLSTDSTTTGCPDIPAGGTGDLLAGAANADWVINSVADLSLIALE